MKRRRPMGSLEVQVLERLWAHDGGVTPAEILDDLDADLAYTTVTTILTRLVAKGLAERERAGRVYLYRPTTTEADLVARRMRAALEQTTDHGAALAGFVRHLSARDERALRALLEEEDG